MNELNLNKATMTLKEITDLLDVDHSKAKLKVDKMVLEPSFGCVAKTAEHILMPNGGTKTIQTYQLDKRQSIAVASRLNTALLMKVIDRWQELESRNAFMPAAVPILTERELLQANLRLLDERDALKTSLEDLRIAGLTIVTELGCDLYFNVAAKILETNLGIRLGHNTLMELLRANGYLLMGTRSIYEKNMPSQKHVDLFRVILHRNEHTGAMTHSTVIRPEGLAHIAPLVCEWLWKHENVKRLSNGMVPLPPPRTNDDQ